MSEYKNIDYVEKPPLGKLRDINKEQIEYLLDLDFEKVSKYPEIQFAAAIAIEELNAFREQFEFKSLQTKEDDVRLIDEKTYDSMRYFQETCKKACGFSSAPTGKVFIRFNKEEYGDIVKKMQYIYVVIHELAHRFMLKLGTDLSLEDNSISFERLREGIADWLTKDIINRRVLPSLTSAENIQSRSDYIKNMRPEHDGFFIEEKEIVPTAPGESVFFLGYIPEIRLIEYLQNNKPEIFQALLKANFEPELNRRKITSNIIEQAFGSEMRDKLGDFKIPTREIIDEITGKSKHEKAV